MAKIKILDIPEFKSGGSIHINPKNKGKFNALKKRTGKSTEELTHSSNALTRKRAIFAQNAKKWHHADGASLDGGVDNQMQITDGGKAKQISSSDHSNPMFEFVGNTHEEGGIGLNFGNNTGNEVENKEIGWVDPEGSLNIFGKLKVPGTNQTFRKAAKDLAESEKKIDDRKAKYLRILNNADEANPYHDSALSTAKVMFKSLDNQSKDIAERKQAIASYQNLILEQSKNPQEHAYGGRVKKYADGGSVNPGDEGLTEDQVQKIIDKYSNGKSPVKAKDFIDVSQKYGVPVDLMLAQAIQESNIGTKGRGARTNNIFNVGNTDSGANEFQSSWKAGLERYAQVIKNQYAKDPNNIDTQDIINSNFTRPRKGGTYASDKDYTPKILNILNTINPNGHYNYMTTSNSNNAARGNPNTDLGLTTVDNSQQFQFRRDENPGVDTPYGRASSQATALSDNVNIGTGNRKRGYMSPLDITQIAPELISLATNKQEPVYQQTYQPDLKQTFDISYQQGRNENQSTFNQLTNIANQAGNVGVIPQLASQKYKADEAYNVQEIQGNATQRLQTYGQNTDVLNDAKLKNLQFISNQGELQAKAKFNTQAQNQAAFSSISGKLQQNKLENTTYNAYANLFKNYGFDAKGNVTFDPNKVTRLFNEGERQQYGLLAAREGIDKLNNNTKTITTLDKDGNVKKTTSIDDDLDEFTKIMGSKQLNDEQKNTILQKRKNQIYLDGYLDH